MDNRKKILIIEKEKRYAQVYEQTLKEAGYSPVSVCTPEEFYEVESSGFKPQIYVVDMFGFGTSKFNAAEWLIQKYPNRPTVILSSLSSVKDCIHSYEIGAMSFVPKSLDVKPLLDALRSI